MTDPTHATEERLTRAQVASRLGISTTTVRRLEWDKLHPVQDDRGIWRFDPEEVAALAATVVPRPTTVGQPSTSETQRRDQRRRGRLAARVFIMFSRNRSLPEIVVATRQPPEVIRELYREWSTSLGEAEWERRDAALTAFSESLRKIQGG